MIELQCNVKQKTPLLDRSAHRCSDRERGCGIADVVDAAIHAPSIVSLDNDVPISINHIHAVQGVYLNLCK